MFDVGFTELVLIGVITLLVVGPERMPGIARTAGFWLGKARRMVGNVKQEFEKEMRAEDLKRIMEEQKKSAGIHEIIETTGQAFDDIKQKTESTVGDLNSTAGNSLTGGNDPADGSTDDDKRGR